MGDIVDNDFPVRISVAYNLKHQLGRRTLAMWGLYQVVDNDDVMYDPNGKR